MEIVLRNNLILINTDFDTLNSAWMRKFLSHHARGMLFLDKAVLIFRNETLSEARNEFIKELSQYHAAKHDFSHEFFLRSMLKFGNQPIRIELNSAQEPQNIKVNLYAYDKNRVLVTLDRANSWVISYLRSQLELYIERGTDTSLVLDLSDLKSRERLDKTLNKRSVLHYQITYTYDSRFMSKLYSEFAHYSFGNLCKEEEDRERNYFYMVLECPVGASQDVLRDSYKKLAKVYHPDKLHNEPPYMIKRYTQKFQLLQEAYAALRVS